MKLSILFSTRNRAKILRQTLETMKRLDVSCLDSEIIVVDNGSVDSTPEVLKEFASKLPLRYLAEPVPGKNRCLNRAVEIAAGDLLVFTDDDVLPDPNWLAAYRDASERWPEDSVFGGRITLAFPANTPNWIRQLKRPYRTYAFSDFDHNLSEGPMERSPTGPNMAIRREVFQRFSYNEDVGPAGTNYAMGSETELLSRLRRDGCRFIYVPLSRVQHIIREEQVCLEWLNGRAFRLGRGGGRIGKDRFMTIFGVSYRIWLALLFAAPLRLVAAPLPERYQFFANWHYHKALGYLHELGWGMKRGKANVSS